MESTQKVDTSGNAVRLGLLLDKVLANYGLAYELGGWRIVTNWAGIVGEKVADVSKALRFSNDTLLVSVRDPVWRHQLSLEVEKILEKIHSIPGGTAVRRIHFIS